MSEDITKDIPFPYMGYFREAERVINDKGAYREVVDLMQEFRDTYLRDQLRRHKAQGGEIWLKEIYNSKPYQLSLKLQNEAKSRLGLEAKVA